jgi:hypothetical protein
MYFLGVMAAALFMASGSIGSAMEAGGARAGSGGEGMDLSLTWSSPDKNAKLVYNWSQPDESTPLLFSWSQADGSIPLLRNFYSPPADEELVLTWSQPDKSTPLLFSWSRLPEAEGAAAGEPRAP